MGNGDGGGGVGDGGEGDGADGEGDGCVGGGGGGVGGGDGGDCDGEGARAEVRAVFDRQLESEATDAGGAYDRRWPRASRRL